MFTGIIKAHSTITNIEGDKDGLIITVKKPDWEIGIGDSITVNGVCSTVKSLDNGVIFEYMPESLIKANLLELKVNDIVNLEQSLTLQHTLDGHLVSGHVDTMGTIQSIEPEGNSFVFTIEVKNADAYMKLLAPKGSVAIDGISLTVVDVLNTTFTVKIIPFTMEETNLSDKKVGSTVNLEFDILAKYVARLLGK